MTPKKPRKRKPKKLKCDDCGSNEGIETTCPYQSDVNNKEVPCILCAKCAYERAMDI